MVFSRASDFGKGMSFLVVDKLTLEKSGDSRNLRKPNFKIGVSSKAVDWLTPDVSWASRKSRSKFLKCICRKWQLTGWHGSFFSLFLKSLDYFLESFWFGERYVVFGSWQVDFGEIYRLEKFEKAKFQKWVCRQEWLNGWLEKFLKAREKREAKFQNVYAANGSWLVDMGPS